MKNKVLHYVLNGVVALPFLLFGLMKIVGAEVMVNNMDAIHYDSAVTRFIGIVEVAAVAGLFIKGYRLFSLTALLVILAGAVGSHIGAGQGLQSVVVPLVISVPVILSIFLQYKYPTAVAG